MKYSDIYIVIPVHNRLDFTKACLHSLSRQSVDGFNVVVVDDGSTDGTFDALKQNFPEVIYIPGNGDLWWSAAMNKGVTYALESNAIYILSLNNDTVVAADFIQRMFESASKHPQALFGAYTLDIETQCPEYGGSRMNWNKDNVQLLDILAPHQRKGLHEVTHFPGRGLWIPAAVFKSIGLFDAVNFPHTAADYDFTLRAARMGFKIFCNYDARLYSHIYASGDWEIRLNFSLKNYIRHLTDIKGGGNLRVFIKYTMRHCPYESRFRYLVTGILSRLGGYPLRWIRHTINHGSINDPMPNL